MKIPHFRITFNSYVYKNTNHGLEVSIYFKRSCIIAQVTSKVHHTAMSITCVPTWLYIIHIYQVHAVSSARNKVMHILCAFIYTVRVSIYYIHKCIIYYIVTVLPTSRGKQLYQVVFTYSRFYTHCKRGSFIYIPIAITHNYHIVYQRVPR